MSERKIESGVVGRRALIRGAIGTIGASFAAELTACSPDTRPQPRPSKAEMELPKDQLSPEQVRSMMLEAILQLEEPGENWGGDTLWCQELADSCSTATQSSKRGREYFRESGLSITRNGEALLVELYQRRSNIIYAENDANFVLGMAVDDADLITETPETFDDLKEFVRKYPDRFSVVHATFEYVDDDNPLLQGVSIEPTLNADTYSLLATTDSGTSKGDLAWYDKIHDAVFRRLHDQDAYTQI